MLLLIRPPLCYGVSWLWQGEQCDMVDWWCLLLSSEWLGYEQVDGFNVFYNMSGSGRVKLGAVVKSV